ncbi:cytoglobin-like [Denticeps clupeoides]|uniref:superoxide dismutase n=1 Tax=Denticeps clupeoides TaxID=299321 RepID=A0AAY4C6A9_9TELE|nr:cytoglobin-like [Denticeps clupeoides]
MEVLQAKVEVGRLEKAEPLSESEVDLIQRSWAPVFQNCETAGVAVLIRLFMNFPSSKQFFSHFQHIDTPEEMKQSDQLKKHAKRVMSAINTLVENLHDGDKVASVLSLVGKSHAIKHKVDPKYFKILGGVILEVLVEDFPDSFSPDVQGAWGKLMALMYCHVTRVYSEVGWV